MFSFKMANENCSKTGSDESNVFSLSSVFADDNNSPSNSMNSLLSGATSSIDLNENTYNFSFGFNSSSDEDMESADTTSLPFFR